MFKNIHGGNIIKAAKKYKIPQGKIIDFSANINPLGIPASVKKALMESIKSIVHYPDPEYTGLLNAMAKYFCVKKENLLAGNGSTELMFLICRALIPKNTLIPIPSFSEYEAAARAAGSKCIFWNAKYISGFYVENKNLYNLLPGADMLFICNPNNPAGYIFPKNELLKISQECKKNNVTMVIDEAFIDFTNNIEHSSMISEAVKNNHIIILRSLTKFFAIPGLRIGCIISNTALINKISQQHYPWNINTLAQNAAITAICDTKYINSTHKFLKKESRYLFTKLKQIPGIKPFVPYANFIFFRILRNDINSTKLTDALGKKGLFVRDCSNFYGLNDKFIRIAVKKRKENNCLLSALNKIFK